MSAAGTEFTLIPSSVATSLRMSKQRSKDTGPELLLRRALHGMGLRYRVHFRVPGSRRTVDVAFTRARVAVLVDGCFWHRCPTHGSLPSANHDWWLAKLQRNVERDRLTNELLAELGWRVMRFWEHEAVSEVAAQVAAVVRSRRPT